MTESVKYPRHCTRHPRGVERVEIIRRYTCGIACTIKNLWRAGPKQKTGMSFQKKLLECLWKSRWHIPDFMRYGRSERGQIIGYHGL